MFSIKVLLLFFFFFFFMCVLSSFCFAQIYTDASKKVPVICVCCALTPPPFLPVPCGLLLCTTPPRGVFPGNPLGGVVHSSRP